MVAPEVKVTKRSIMLGSKVSGEVSKVISSVVTSNRHLK